MISINKNAQKINTIMEKLLHETWMLNLLSGLGINRFTSISNAQRYNHEYYWEALTAETSGLHDEQSKLVIEVKCGEPSIEQVYDAVYGKGANCDTKIILVTNDFQSTDEDDPAADEIMLPSLVGTMNQYPVNLYLVELNGWDSKTKKFKIKVVAKPEGSPRYSAKNLPSSKKFREAEFWNVFVHSLVDGDFYEAENAFVGGIHNQSLYRYYWRRWKDGATFLAEWTEDGLILSAKTTAYDPDFLLRVFDTKRLELQELFEPALINLRMEPDKWSELSLRVLNFPFERVVNALTDERKAYAQLVTEAYFKFHSFLDDAARLEE